MKKNEIPARPRKHIRFIVDRLRRGILTFEYLERRKAKKSN